MKKKRNCTPSEGFILCTYTAERPKDATFYIQCKGLHSGRPLREPIPNCFAVITKQSQLFELVYSLYISKQFERLLIGSVIPFIRIAEARALIQNFAPIANPKCLAALHQVDQFVNESEQRYKKALQLREAFAMQALKQ